MKIPEHIETAMQVMRLHDAQLAGKITETGQQQLALLREKLEEQMSSLPMPKFQDPFGLLED